MKKHFELVIPLDKMDSTVKITEEQAKVLGIDISLPEIHGELKTYGPWQIPVSYTAVCVDRRYVFGDYGFKHVDQITIFGKRKMVELKQTGYALDGRISIKGKKYTGFTSSVLFELPDGKLIDVAVISARYSVFPK